MANIHVQADQGTALTACRSEFSALIVDDEPHVRTFMRMILKKLGVVTVWEASDGVEALAAFEKHRPSLVLLDQNMPIMTGTEVMRALVNLDSTAVVMVVSSGNDLRTIREFQELGAAGYLLKHSPREQITDIIAELLRDLREEAA